MMAMARPGSANLPIGVLRRAIQENGAPRKHQARRAAR
jgi:hypothetical protein